MKQKRASRLTKPQKKGREIRTEYLAVKREIVTDRTAAGPYETKWSNNKGKKK